MAAVDIASLVDDANRGMNKDGRGAVMGEDEVNLFLGWWLAGIEDGSVVDHGTSKINHRSMLVGNVLEDFIVLRPLRSPCTFILHIYKYTSPLSKCDLSLSRAPLFMPAEYPLLQAFTIPFTNSKLRLPMLIQHLNSPNLCAKPKAPTCHLRIPVSHLLFCVLIPFSR